MSRSDREWAKMRVEYESGTVKSIVELSKKYKVNAGTLTQRAHRENWVKAKDKEQIHRSVQQLFMEELIAQGMGVPYMVGKIKELMEATDSLIVDGQPVAGISNKNWTAISSGLKEALKILGAYAPQEQNVNIKVKLDIVVRKVVGIVDRYCPAEMRGELAREVEVVFEEIG